MRGRLRLDDKCVGVVLCLVGLGSCVCVCVCVLESHVVCVCVEYSLGE